MKLFDWDETFVLSYYISYYSTDCEMTTDDSKIGDVWHSVTSQKNW